LRRRRHGKQHAGQRQQESRQQGRIRSARGHAGLA
jgi:hypothetical protein